MVVKYRETCKEEPESNSHKQKKPSQSQGPNRNICKCLTWLGVHTLKRGILPVFKKPPDLQNLSDRGIIYTYQLYEQSQHL